MTHRRRDAEDLRAPGAEGARRRRSPTRQRPARRGRPRPRAAPGRRRDLLAGGKRLRAGLLLLGLARRGRRRRRRRSSTAAASLELLQASALDPRRRDGRQRHPPGHALRRTGASPRCTAAAGWLGSPEPFGVGGAILLGDLCCPGPTRCSARSGLPPDVAGRGRSRSSTTMRTELMCGQYLDLLEQAARREHRRAARCASSRYKSGEYTVEQPLRLGGRWPRASRSRGGRAARLRRCRSAWPSSCATTSSASSATRR